MIASVLGRSSIIFCFIAITFVVERRRVTSSLEKKVMDKEEYLPLTIRVTHIAISLSFGHGYRYTPFSSPIF